MPPLAMFGVWEDGAFVGAVLFGRGANMNMGKMFGLAQTQAVELVRVALTAHASPVTRIVSICIRQLSSTSPSLRLLISYADPAQGHTGKIYQAGNWTFTGEAEVHRVFFHDGKWKHKREIASMVTFGKKRAAPIDWNALPSRTSDPKYRYAYPLDAEMTTKIKAMSLPYPKLSGEKSSPRGATTGEGGAIPTSPHLFDLGVPRFPELPWSALRRLDVLAPGETDPGDDAQIGFAF